MAKLSAFADEVTGDFRGQVEYLANEKVGYIEPRFIDKKNIMDLNQGELKEAKTLIQDHGLKVSAIGSPIGKVKLEDVEDGTTNKFIPFKKYLNQDVKKACDLAHAFETKLIRGFSFYHPKGTDPKDHFSQAVDQLGQIAEKCHRSDLTFGLEVEPNLVGENGYLLAELYRQVNHPAMVLIFDAANIIVQGYTPGELLEQFQLMRPGLGWLHIKDYHHPKPVKRTGHIDEDALANFVPADRGDSAHEAILRDFRHGLPKLHRRLRRRGIPGVFLDLEPHVKGGGQFGGFSGPDGMGVALRALCKVLDYVDIDYHLRDFDDVKIARGF